MAKKKEIQPFLAKKKEKIENAEKGNKRKKKET